MPNVHLSVLDLKYLRSSTFGVQCNDVEAIIGLLRELLDDKDGSRPLQIKDRMDLFRLVTQEKFRLVVARDIDKSPQDEPNIVGIGMIHWNETGVKVTAYIDDVVVSGQYQQQGIGKKLTLRLIDIAKSVGAKCIDLTSKPDRGHANEMYVKLGFKKRDTNYYRLDL